MTDTFCPLPWNHFSTHTDGCMRLCCNSTHEGRLKENGKLITINEITSLIDFYNIDQLKNIRKKMIAGERTPECQHCYDVEDNNGTSVRQWFANRWPMQQIINNTDFDTGKIDNVNINYLDLSWSNKCNLQCKMCTPAASDQLFKEFKFINNSNNWSEWDYKDRWDYNQIEKVLKLIQTSSLDQILVTGGEPLINNDFYAFCKELIASGLSKQIDLSIHTNLTVTPSKWFDIWKHFKSMTIKVSIDAYGEMYEYVRYPGKWSIIKENIDSIIQYSNETKSVGIEFHTVFSIFNTEKFTELLDYITGLKGDNVLNFPHMNYIYGPDYASPSNLPEKYKKKVAEEITKWLVNNKFFNHENLRIQEKVTILQSMIMIMSTTNVSKADAEQSYAIIKKMDYYRKHDTKKYLPWFNKI